MRWQICRIDLGSRRTVRKFLWFPKTLQSECRWLEMANILQVWGGYSRNDKTFYKWQDHSWADSCE